MKAIQIAPSILSCNFLRLEEEITAVEAAGADMIHIDVMDGHFVPNITIGPLIVEAVKRVAKKPLDVHLMIDNPQQYVKDFASAGADLITVHQEADYHLYRAIDLIRSSGCRAGVSLNPSTPLSLIKDILADIDLLLIMSVNPGFGGQSYIPSMTAKIREARAMIEAAGTPVDLEVDGGLKAENARTVVDAGANVLVMGTEIFHSPDYTQKIARIRANLAG